ncbi:hypothetical protein CHARACLAT_027807 [Characodon lateralis]|uniref:Uncharacterized protein n=1 Tax=Characodon lateralis TaxID=208331 RepID=A0ABU7EMV2_9TELE|nr:hypothetical protein [Characodon lateralis]
MALGLLLWISLLLNLSAGFSTPTGGQYQSLPDTQNPLDEEFFNALATEGAGDVLDNKQSSPVIVQYNWPLVSANQNQPEPQTRPVIAKPSQSVSSPNAAEWSGQDNEVDNPPVRISPPWKPSSPNQVDEASYKDWMSMPVSDIFNGNLFFDLMDFQPENSVNYEVLGSDELSPDGLPTGPSLPKL